jgi:hypothetical protein
MDVVKFACSALPKIEAAQRGVIKDKRVYFLMPAVASTSRLNTQSMSAHAFPPSQFDREFINAFLNSPLADHEDVCDIRPGDVRPVPGLENRDLYATAARVAEIFYHSSAYDLGAPPEFRSESNQSLEPAAALILAQVAVAADATANGERAAFDLAPQIHAAWVHAWLAVRDQLPRRAAENRFVKPWAEIADHIKLREAIFIKLAYQIVRDEPGTDIGAAADICMQQAEYILNRWLPSIF